jgi:hypothetical protein
MNDIYKSAIAKKTKPNWRELERDIKELSHTEPASSSPSSLQT